jgi:hypothetical protein
MFKKYIWIFNIQIFKLLILKKMIFINILNF